MLVFCSKTKKKKKKEKVISYNMKQCEFDHLRPKISLGTGIIQFHGNDTWSL